MQKFDAPFGHVEAFDTNAEFGASVLVIYPGREIPAEHHKKMTELEVVLDGELEFQGRKLKKGSCRINKPGDVHGYKNVSSKEVRVLCITVPPYDPEDIFH